jgi:hypothetical protein
VHKKTLPLRRAKSTYEEENGVRLAIVIND